MVANLAALAAGTAASLAREVRWPVLGTALAGLAVAVALMGRATVAATVLGQASAAVLVVAIVRRAGAAAGDRGGAAGLGALTAAWTAGMGLFVLLVFAYYAAYDVVLPAGNGWLPALAAVLLGLAAAGSMRGRRPGGPGAGGRARGRDLVPVGVGVALLAAPLASWATAPGPAAPVQDEGPARPVRVLSYNLHFGFDVRGWSDLEGVAQAIEASGAEVVGLQEVSRGWYVNGATDMLAWLQRRLRMPYARFAGASDAIWGNALLSRYPIVAGEVVRLPREGVPLRRNALRAELDLGRGGACRWSSPTSTTSRGRTAPGSGWPRSRGCWSSSPAGHRAHGRPQRRARLGRDRPAAGGRHGRRVHGRRRRAADAPTWPADRPDRRIDWIWLSGDLAATGFAATTSTASDHRGIAVTVRPRPAGG